MRTLPFSVLRRDQEDRTSARLVLTSGRTREIRNPQRTMPSRQVKQHENAWKWVILASERRVYLAEGRRGVESEGRESRALDEHIKNLPRGQIEEGFAH